jgi:hypothetical protein
MGCHHAAASQLALVLLMCYGYAQLSGAKKAAFAYVLATI